MRALQARAGDISVVSAVSVTSGGSSERGDRCRVETGGRFSDGAGAGATRFQVKIDREAPPRSKVHFAVPGFTFRVPLRPFRVGLASGSFS